MHSLKLVVFNIIIKKNGQKNEARVTKKSATIIHIWFRKKYEHGSLKTACEAENRFHP